VSERTRTPVPPLGDAAISRIERGLFAALDSALREGPRPLAQTRPEGARRRGLAFALASVAAAALFGVREVRRGETLPGRAGQISTTTSGSRLAIDGATLEVAPQSSVSFGGRRDGTVVVVLDRGTVTCEVAPRAKRAPFVVEAGATRVTVIGTKFSVHRAGEHAEVTVEHGLVEVADTNMTELVHAGERYRPGEPVMREALASEAPAVVTPAAPVAVTPAVAAVTPTPAADPGPAVARPAPDRALAAARHRRVALAEPAAPARPDERPAAAPEPEAAVAAAEAEAPAAAEPPPPAAKAAVAPLGQQGRSVQVLFELAAQLEIRDPEAALRIYGELAGPETPSEGGWAASALFAAARLEAERGHARQARELCEAYLRRFPRGPNADDARTLLAPAR
jgi:hypothetical protein